MVNGVKTEFITSGIQLLAQKSDEGIITWQIDGNGSTVGFTYGNQVYFYLKNAQGDIIGIADSTGTEVATYVYDSWGKLISVKDENGVEIVDKNHIGHKNPLRYRGYYYDEETGLYYLNARYYDPETGRFVSADDNLEGGLNLYCYCGNNPVMNTDSTGKKFTSYASLEYHYGRHGKEFDFQSIKGDDDYEDDMRTYERMSESFFAWGIRKSSSAQVKRDSIGVLRIYDSVTNYFGSYTPDGRTITFFRPTRGQGYFDDEEGTLI